MKKFIVISSMILALTGCVQGSAMYMAKQDYVCKDKGGVYEYARTVLRPASCRDGSLVSEWTNVILSPEFYPEVKK